MSDDILLKIGKKIKEARREQELTLLQVADKANISKSLLSKIENSRTVPSLPVFVSVIQALELDLGGFFTDLENLVNYNFIHKNPDEYTIIEKEEARGFIYRSILNRNLSNISIEVVLLDLLPGSERDPVSTDGYEFKYILSGEVVYKIGEEIVELKEGDTLFFNGRVPHVPMNKSNKKATMLVLYFLFPQEEV